MRSKWNNPPLSETAGGCDHVLRSPDGSHSRWMLDVPLVIRSVCSLDRSVV